MADTTDATAVRKGGHGSQEEADGGSSSLSASSRIRVRHRTFFQYEVPVSGSVNTIHLVPRQFPLQRTVSGLVRVLPATRLRAFHDLFNNITHHFELPDPHSTLDIESRVVVENLELDLTERDRGAGIEVYSDPEIREVIWPFLQDSRFVVCSPGMWRVAIDATIGVAPVFGRAEAIMNWIHQSFEYRPGSTNVQTRPGEVLESRCGVCQDFAHVMLGLCRSIGIPARYASGYLYNGPSDHLIGSQASHAWCEVFLPDTGWVGFDPTNNNLADDRYVKIAVGRDYADVTPVRGTYRGNGYARMEVEVQVDKE